MGKLTEPIPRPGTERHNTLEKTDGLLLNEESKSRNAEVEHKTSINISVMESSKLDLSEI